MRVDNHTIAFQQQRKRIAKKNGTPRILKIHFHTLRHFKGTMLYHKTKDLLYVMQALGNKNIKITLLYIQHDEALFQGEIDYISKEAKTPGEISVLIKADFEYVTEFKGLKFFRKRKSENMKNQEKTCVRHQDKPSVCFNTVVQGVGFEPSVSGDVTHVSLF